MRVTKRDELILQEIDRWRACGGRHIRFLAGFSGQRATDRRLRILMDAEYIERKKYLYGVPGIYFLTTKGKSLIQATARPEKVKVEQIVHDMTVLDTAIYFMHKQKLTLDDITTEKQLHQQDGFGVRKHRPDFVFQKDDETNCVEVELTLKAKIVCLISSKTTSRNMMYKTGLSRNHSLESVRFWWTVSDIIRTLKLFL